MSEIDRRIAYAVCWHGSGEVAHILKSNFTTYCGTKVSESWEMSIGEKPKGKFDCHTCIDALKAKGEG